MHGSIRAAFICLVCGALTGYCADGKPGRMELVGTNVVALGTYPNTEDRAVRVQIKNVGEGALRVERVVTTCKCMRVDAYPHVLAPGEKGDVAVTILANEVAGVFDRVFFIEGDDPVNRSIKVKIEGNAKPLFSVTCDAQTALGPVEAGLVWTGRYTVAATEAAIFLGPPTVQNRGTRCDYSIRTNQQAQIVYEVTHVVTFEGDGIMESVLLFPVLRKEGEKPWPVRLFVEAVRKRPIKVVPDRIQVAAAAVPVKRRLLLTIESPAPLELSKLSWKTELEGVEILPQLSKSGKGFFINLTFPGAVLSKINSALGAKIVFQYDKWVIEVPVQAGN